VVLAFEYRRRIGAFSGSTIAAVTLGALAFVAGAVTWCSVEHARRRSQIMKKLASLAAVAAIALVGVGTAPASAAPAQHDVHIEDYDAYEYVAAEENPCGNWAATMHEVWSGEIKLVTPSGVKRAGEVHVNMVIDGFVELIPDDTSRPTYSGTYQEKADGVVVDLTEGSGAERVMQFRLQTRFLGTDGSTLTLTLSGKVTTNGNGVLVVARDSTTCK
jgi:hypothetical protein